jgi:purine-nucleoside phosphorylase
MEASAVFTVADYRGADAGAMFVVSDHLGPSGWEPAFHETEGELHRLGDIAKEALTTHVG